MLAALLGGAPTTLVHAFGAWQIDGVLANQLAQVQTPLLVGGLALLLGACLLRFRQDVVASGAIPHSRLIAYGTAAVILLMVANKVLSPQFLVWLLPLAPLLPRPQAFLAVSVSLLTSVFLGANYQGLMQQRPELVLLLDLRNLLLVVLLVWIVARNAPSWRRYVICRVDSLLTGRVLCPTARWPLTSPHPRARPGRSRSQMQNISFTSVAANVLRTRAPHGAADAGDVCPS